MPGRGPGAKLLSHIIYHRLYLCKLTKLLCDVTYKSWAKPLTGVCVHLSGKGLFLEKIPRCKPALYCYPNINIMLVC